MVDNLESKTRDETAEYKPFSHLKGVGIGINQAAIKYGVNQVTLSGWVKRGYIRRLSGIAARGQRVLIDESDAAYCAAVYHKEPGQGKRTMKKIAAVR